MDLVDSRELTLPFRTRDRLDGLAAIRVETARRVQLASVVGDGRQRRPGLLEGDNLGVELVKMMLEKVHNVATRCLTLFSHPQDGRDLIEAQPGRLRILHKSEPFERALRIDSVAVVGPLWFGEHPELFVVADRFG